MLAKTNMIKMEKINKKLILHIAIIIIGIIFVSIPVFHSNIWFDESYSVSISNHSFTEIWSIGGHDVHPILYYWVLHIINLIFGDQIILYRIFSLLCIVILGVIGYTHIRKDFGENTGILFSFLAFFFPTNVVYAGEIGMYTMAMLLVTLMSIYAYRIYRNRDKKYIKNWILFFIFSIASAYTHYYGLMAAGLVNIMLFISFIIEAKKEKKFTYNLKAFLISGVMHVILYMPWVISLLVQIKQVSAGFWISIKFPDTLIEFFTFQFTGNLGGTLYIPNLWAGIFGIIICAYMIFIYVKNRKNEELKPARKAITVWCMVALGAYIVSLIISRTIIYARYMLCVTGLFIFFIAHTMAIKGNKKVNAVICIISIIISIIVVTNLSKENYDVSNREIFNYLEENVQETDAFLHGNAGSGFVIIANYLDNKEYFYDEENWNVEEAYKAFAKDMQTIYDLEEIKEYKGRIWIINANDYSIYEQVKEKYDVELIEQKLFKTKYKGFEYTLSLVEKK